MGLSLAVIGYTYSVTYSDVYLVGNGAHLHCHASLPGQKFGEGMSRQGKSMADTRCVQQQSIQHVLIHVCTLQVFVAEDAKSTFMSSF